MLKQKARKDILQHGMIGSEWVPVYPQTRQAIFWRWLGRTFHSRRFMLRGTDLIAKDEWIRRL